jgi:4-hydroxy-3-methylbut-2-enyl diphosphate reductase
VASKDSGSLDSLHGTAGQASAPQSGIYRHGFGLKDDVEASIEGDYHSGIVEELKKNDFHLDLGPLQLFLAREFGFCYGVDKAVDYAYQTRRMFPDRRIFLTTEIIHNPGVNRRLLDMGIGFLSGRYRSRVAFDDLTPEDVVILPAFGASVEEIDRLKAHGCTLVDTTCGSVIHVWKRVEKYAREGFTAIIHGKYQHEETIGTSSRVSRYPGGRYLVVRDQEEAQAVCDFITGKVSGDALAQRFASATSPGFDPRRDLVRVGVANQTTMLSSESLEIAGMFRDAMTERYGEEGHAEHFRTFDTICSATQDRQDAMHQLGTLGLDLILVVGGFNSSNTTHLVEIAATYTRAYHIEDASHIVSASEIHHKLWDRNISEAARDWMPPLPLRVGFTAGASTPNRAVGEVIARIVELCGLALPSPA